MALRHPWFSQTLKRKHPDDPEGSGGGGLGVGGTVYGGVEANAYNVGQVTPQNQSSNSNGRVTKRSRKLESRNLERGFAELSIQPPAVPSPPPFLHLHQPGTQIGGDGLWGDVVGNVGECSSVVCPDGSTLPLLRPSLVHEPPSPEVNDVQMSTPTWYEPEKDRIVITSLDDDEYDGDDEGHQQQHTGASSITPGSEFTISPAFLNAINKKLTRVADPTPPTDTSRGQALILFRPLPTIALPPAEDDLEGPSGQADSEEGMLDSSPPKPPPPSPLLTSPFHVEVSGQPSFVSNDDDMEIEML